MKRLLLVLVVGCSSSEHDFPVTPGGAGFGGNNVPRVDASFDVGDGGPQLPGRVCLMLDPRDQTSCSPTGAGGLVVTLGTEIATTADDGTFVIAQPQSSAPTWTVTGTNIVPTVTPFSAQAVIPAMPLTTYLQLEGDNGVVPQAGQGAVMVRVLVAGVPLPGAAVTANPAGIYGTFYDGTSPSAWTSNATGAFGAAWIPALATGTVDITVTPPQGATPVILRQIPIVESAVTFLTEAFR